LSDQIRQLAAELQERRGLGRSDTLNRLFECLVEASDTGARLKEFEIASAVFGRSAAFDGAEDASVRVAIHRLRKKLDEYYAAEPPGAPRLWIPVGEYRIAVIQIEDTAPPPPGPRLTRPMLIALAAGVVLIVAAFVAGALIRSPAGERTLVRGSAPWSDLISDKRPTLIVLGDYYIFGEIDDASGVNRLVREYNVNSPSDLENWVMQDPIPRRKYMDLSLHYLPIGSAVALRDVTSVLANARSGEPKIITVSELTSDMLRRNNVVYIGYLSGLGILAEPTFTPSRFKIGETYDELIDLKTDKRFISQEGGPMAGEASQKDYGYVANYVSPQGTRIVIIAGTRDTALMQSAETMTERPSLRALLEKTSDPRAFEAVYEVEGFRRGNLAGKLVVTEARAARRPQPVGPEG
jgi:hypothetical protein